MLSIHRALLQVHGAFGLLALAAVPVCALGLGGILLGRVPGNEFADGLAVACISFALRMLVAVTLTRPGRAWIVAHLAGLGGAVVFACLRLRARLVARRRVAVP
jgi:hypothetical protein